MIVMSRSTVPRRATVLLALTAPLLTACGGGLGDSAAETGPRVVAAFYPLEYVAERVAGEHAQITNLTSPGADSHDLELTVRQTAELSEADLVVYLEDYQPAVDGAVDQNGPEHVLQVTDVVELAESGAEGGDHADEDDHAGETEEEHAEHAGEGDPHFWLDPVRLGEVAAAFAEKMAEIDPDHAEAYDANAEELQADLRALDQEYEQGLADCALDTVVVSHDAFGYLTKYGVHFEAIAGLSPDVEPSPAHLAELQDLIRSEGVSTVFSETLASPAMAESLASDLGLETGVLDPVEGLSEETAGEDYLSLMRTNLERLQRANDCT